MPVFDSVAARDDGRFVLFVLGQFVAIAVVLAACAVYDGAIATTVTVGALAIVIPNAIFTLVVRRARPIAIVTLAMIRSVFLAFVVIFTYMVFAPELIPYFVGAAIGLAVGSLAPVVLTSMRPFTTKKAESN